MTDQTTTHDQALFEQLEMRAEAVDRAVRRGVMFGSPAVFVGQKMAACVYGSSIALRVPEEIARLSVDTGRVTRFQPPGRAPMREWVQIPGSTQSLDDNSDLLVAAIFYARANNVG
ncbi:MAG: hypothetical protein R2715_25225 [Ilumatobacteraceae bacterium]|nr:hypothetical protein [Microbacteriaceae bacterium]